MYDYEGIKTKLITNQFHNSKVSTSRLSHSRLNSSNLKNSKQGIYYKIIEMKGQYVVTGEVYDELGDEYIIIFTFNPAVMSNCAL